MRIPAYNTTILFYQASLNYFQFFRARYINLNDVKKDFAAIDTNGDGMISREEMGHSDTFNQQVIARFSLVRFLSFTGIALWISTSRIPLKMKIAKRALVLNFVALKKLNKDCP